MRIENVLHNLTAWRIFWTRTRLCPFSVHYSSLLFHFDFESKMLASVAATTYLTFTPTKSTLSPYPAQFQIGCPKHITMYGAFKNLTGLFSNYTFLPLLFHWLEQFWNAIQTLRQPAFLKSHSVCRAYCWGYQSWNKKQVLENVFSHLGDGPNLKQNIRLI